eukprot:371085-Hanusia_phi.AAC.4
MVEEEEKGVRGAGKRWGMRMNGSPITSAIINVIRYCFLYLLTAQLSSVCRHVISRRSSIRLSFWSLLLSTSTEPSSHIMQASVYSLCSAMQLACPKTEETSPTKKSARA